MQEEQISLANKLRHNRWVATILARKKHGRISSLYKYASVSYYACNKIMGGTKHMLSLTVSERTILHRKIFLLADGTKNTNESLKKTGNYADQADSLIRSCCSSCSSQVPVCSLDAVQENHASAAGSSSRVRCGSCSFQVCSN
jgi:hypothetical protein